MSMVCTLTPPPSLILSQLNSVYHCWLSMLKTLQLFFADIIHFRWPNHIPGIPKHCISTFKQILHITLSSRVVLKTQSLVRTEITKTKHTRKSRDSPKADRRRENKNKWKTSVLEVFSDMCYKMHQLTAQCHTTNAAFVHSHHNSHNVPSELKISTSNLRNPSTFCHSPKFYDYPQFYV